MKQSKKILSIQIRDISLHNEQYELKIQPQGLALINVGKTQPTIFPIFPITKALSHIYPYFYFDFNQRFLIYLVSVKENKSVHAFDTSIPDVKFIGSDLSLMKIIRYPVILFEFHNGFYTTEESFGNIKSAETSEASSISEFVLINPSQLSQKKASAALKDIGFYHFPEPRKRYTATAKELETVRAQYKKKHDEFLSLLKDHLDKIKACQEYNSSNEISKKRQKAEELKKTQNSLTKEVIIKLKSLNESIRDRVQAIENMIKVYTQELIDKKSKIPQLSIDVAFANKVNTIFIKRFLAEYSFVFFNQKLSKYITLPPFYAEEFSDQSKIRRLTYFENNEKKISLLLGQIAQMITLFSKTLNVPIRYPLYVHGATSSLVKAVNTYIKLYSFSVNSNFEKGFDCVKDMLSVLLSYLINKELATTVVEVEKEVTALKKNSNHSDNLFEWFIVFNLYLNTFISGNQHSDNTFSFYQTFQKKPDKQQV